MPENPLKPIEDFDPELLKTLQAAQMMALGEGGALPKKVKLLIALALDASHGSANGVKALSGAAMANGATKQEVAEALRVAYYISGAGSVYTAADAFRT
ncbi:MAG: carboxymuconolactone decarboxylase family protein [Chloroflexota bacterium]